MGRIMHGLEIAAPEVVVLQMVGVDIPSAQNEQPACAFISLVEIDEALGGRIECTPSSECIDGCRP
jgi:hypothetical protein